MAGELRRAVAKTIGVSERAVRAWARTAERRETPQPHALADRAATIAAEIERLGTLARHRLIERIADLAPDSTDLVAVTNAYGKLTDRALLRAGKPTAITQSVDQMDVEIEGLLAKMREREAQGE